MSPSHHHHTTSSPTISSSSPAPPTPPRLPFGTFSPDILPHHVARYLDDMFPDGASQIQMQSLLLLWGKCRQDPVAMEPHQQQQQQDDDIADADKETKMSRQKLQLEKFYTLPPRILGMGHQIWDSDADKDDEDDTKSTQQQQQHHSSANTIQHHSSTLASSASYLNRPETSLLMESKSGTGKTLAYLLMALYGVSQNWRHDSRDTMETTEPSGSGDTKHESKTDDSPKASLPDILILLPTNELVWQVHQEIHKLLSPCIQRSEIEVKQMGPKTREKQKSDDTSTSSENSEKSRKRKRSSEDAPQQGHSQKQVPSSNSPPADSPSKQVQNPTPPHQPGRRIFLSTPQRWLNALNARKINNFENIGIVVLDEVDALMNDQIRDQVKRCWSRLFKCRKRNKLPRARVLAYSATFEKWVISELVRCRIVKRDDALFESVIPRFDRSVKGIKEYYTLINKQETRSQTLILKEQILVQLLREIHFHQCIIFCNRKARCAALMKFLRHNNVPGVVELASGVKHEIREKGLNQFFSCQSPILVATDVAARGLDVSTVDLVINLDVPHDAPTYMHRVGRAGRFERMGACISIVADTQEQLFEYVRRLSSNELHLLPLNDLSQLNQYMHTPTKEETTAGNQTRSDPSENSSPHHADMNKWSVFRQNMEQLKDKEFEYLEDADEEVATSASRSANCPKEYMFDFDLPVTNEGATSLQIGHIQVYLPRTDADTSGTLEAMEPITESTEHPFSLLPPYEMALQNPQQLAQEAQSAVYADCARVYRDRIGEKQNEPEKA